LIERGRGNVRPGKDSFDFSSFLFRRDFTPPCCNSLYRKELYNESSEAGLKNKAVILPDSGVNSSDNGAIKSNKTSVPPDGGNDNNLMF
jgi:hypothetical protein